jgi:hypothetical protein
LLHSIPPQHTARCWLNNVLDTQLIVRINIFYWMRTKSI